MSGQVTKIVFSFQGFQNGRQHIGFFYVGSPKESIFFDHHLWSIFQSSLHTLQVTFLHYIDLLWAAFMYCISSCLSDLWLLSHGSCTSVFMLRIWSYCRFQSGPPKRLESYTIWPRLYAFPIQIWVRRKDSLPCQDSNPVNTICPTPQANVLPIKLSRLNKTTHCTELIKYLLLQYDRIQCQWFLT